MRFAIRALVVLPAIELSRDAGADVLQVGAGGYATPQQAVDAASDGDLILISGGAHPGFVITDKQLFVAPLPATGAVTLGSSRVENLAAPRSAVLVEFQFGALSVVGCSGAPQLVGQLDATGTLAAPVAFLALPVRTPNSTWHVQSYFASPTGAVRLGPPACVAQLPSIDARALRMLGGPSW